MSDEGKQTKAGRPKGSRSKGKLSEKTISKAFKNVVELVENGDKEASLLVVQLHSNK